MTFEGKSTKENFLGNNGYLLESVILGCVAEWNEYEMLVVVASELMAKQAKMIIKSAY